MTTAAIQLPYEVIKCENRTEWLKERRKGIGGSDAAAILDQSHWKSPLSVYADKLAIDEPDAEPSEFMEWGLLLEDPIADKYQWETGRHVIDPGRWTIYRNREHPFLSCTVDRDIIPAPADITRFFGIENPTEMSADQLGVLEIKTAAGFKRKEWTEEGIPLYYDVQIQHSFLVTGRRWGSFAVLFGGQSFGYIDVERNDRFCQFLLEKESEFWERLQKGNPPEATADDSKVLEKLYQEHGETTIALPGEAVAKGWEREELIAKIKDLEGEKAKIENWFKQQIGEATFGIAPDGTRWKWSTIERKGYTVKPSSFRQLRRLKD